jgi:pimeloyl-ACP methyl ester carboxylesterase
MSEPSPVAGFATNPGDGARIRFEDDGGAGRPVVILGGFLDPIALVRRAPIARALAAVHDGFRLVFADHRGHGRSDAPHDPDAYAMPRRAADVVAVLDHLGIERAHVVGISWGARLGFGLVEHAEDRVRSLTAIGQHPYAIAPDGPLARVVGDALADASAHGIEPLVEAFESIAGRYPDDVRAAYLACDALAMQAAWRAALAEGAVSGDPGRWRTPVLVCVAEQDEDFREPARRAAAEIPGARFVAIRDTDHLGVDTASSEGFLPEVLTLLRGGAPPV